MTKFTNLAEALNAVATAQSKNTFYDLIKFEGTTAELFASGWELGNPLPPDQNQRVYYPITKDGAMIRVRVHSMNAKSIVIKTNSTEKTIGDNKFAAESRFLVELI